RLQGDWSSDVCSPDLGPGAAIVVVAGGGVDGVVGGPVGVPEGTVGSATVAVCVGVAGSCTAPGPVATWIGRLLLPDVTISAAAIPATRAITSASSTGQIQSPGYHANRSCHARARTPTTPCSV